MQEEGEDLSPHWVKTAGLGMLESQAVGQSWSPMSWAAGMMSSPWSFVQGRGQNLSTKAMDKDESPGGLCVPTVVMRSGLLQGWATDRRFPGRSRGGGAERRNGGASVPVLYVS